MVTPAAGTVVLVSFPFSDLSQAKLRPAVVLADAGRGDWILCQITSNPYGDARAIALTDVSFAAGSLKSLWTFCAVASRLKRCEAGWP
jgi:mRNA interferase MazF